MSELNLTLSELPFLIKRCLALGVKVLPFQLNYILLGYVAHEMPDEELIKLDNGELEYYVKALYLSSQEASKDWARGHEMLSNIGFVRTETKEGCRLFIKLLHKNSHNIKLENKE